MMDSFAALDEHVSSTILASSVTISEAKLIQYCKDTRMTNMIKKTSIQEEIDGLVDRNLASDDIENCIYEKTLEYLKS